MNQVKLGKLALLLLMWPAIMAADCRSTIKCPEGQGFIDGTDQCQPKECFANPALCEDGGMSVCDTCSAEQHCDLANAKCVACLKDNHCGTDKPKCDTESGECVACKTDGDCDASAPYCVGETNVCSVCRTNADCNDVASPRCDKQAGMCKPECETDSDCMGNAIGAFCNLATSTCVACLPNPENPDAEETACPGTSCNPQTFTCTATPKRSITQCNECEADRDCMDGFRCVAQTYAGSNRGGRCLDVFTAGDSCKYPLGTFLEERVTTSGFSGSFCGVNEALTTCEAVQALGSACDDSMCPTSGICENIGGQKCNYLCADSGECPATGTFAGCNIHCGG